MDAKHSSPSPWSTHRSLNRISNRFRHQIDIHADDCIEVDQNHTAFCEQWLLARELLQREALAKEEGRGRGGASEERSGLDLKSLGIVTKVGTRSSVGPDTSRVGLPPQTLSQQHTYRSPVAVEARKHAFRPLVPWNFTLIRSERRNPPFKHKTLPEPKQGVPSSPLPTPWSLLWTGATHPSAASPPTSIQRDPRARRAHYRKATDSSHHHDLFERSERGISNSAAERGATCHPIPLRTVEMTAVPEKVDLITKRPQS